MKGDKEENTMPQLYIFFFCLEIPEVNRMTEKKKQELSI